MVNYVGVIVIVVIGIVILVVFGLLWKCYCYKRFKIYYWVNILKIDFFVFEVINI